MENSSASDGPSHGVDQEYAKGEAKHKGGSYVRVRSCASARTTTTSRILRAWRRWSSPPTNGSRTPRAAEDAVDSGRSKAAQSSASTNRTGAPSPRWRSFRTPIPGDVGQNAVDRAAAAAKVRSCTAGERVCGGVGGDANDAVAGQPSPPKTRNAPTRTSPRSFNANRNDWRRADELRRADMAVKARKAMPALERAKFPWTETGEPKDLEDMTAKELEVMTTRLITCCLAHGRCASTRRPRRH